MRQRTIHRLADLGRAAALLGSVAAAVVLLLFTCAGERLQPLEDWLRQRQTAGLAALAHGDEAALRAASRQLQDVRGRDRKADAVRSVERQLLALAQARGDAAAALGHARRLWQLDPRDLDAAADLADLLAASPAGEAEAIDLLQQALPMATSARSIVAPLARLWLQRGKLDEAGAILLAAADAPASGIWRLRWGGAADQAAWLLPRRCRDGRVELPFAIDDAVDRLQLQLPPGAARSLGEVELELQGRCAPLAEWPVQLHDLVAEGTELLASGDGRPGLQVAVSAAAPVAGALRWRQQERLPDWLRALLRDDGRGLAGSSAPALRRLRGRALDGVALRLEAGGSALAAALRGTASEHGLEWQLECALPRPAAAMVLHLPPQLAVLLPLSLQAQGNDGAATAVDPLRPTASNDVDFAEGSCRITGPAPRLEYALPAGTAAVRLRGVCR